MSQPGPGERLREASSKAGDLSWILPFVGLLLFMPPILDFFDVGRYLFGLPLLLVYLFAIWLVGILLTGLAARRLQRARDGEEGQE